MGPGGGLAFVGEHEWVLGWKLLVLDRYQDHLKKRVQVGVEVEIQVCMYNFPDFSFLVEKMS